MWIQILKSRFIIQEIVSDPQFIADGASRFDVEQGELGTNREIILKTDH